MNSDFDRSVFAEVHRVYLPPLRSIIQAILAIPTRVPLQLAWYRSPHFEKKIDELCGQHDLVLAHLVRTGQYLADRKDIPCVLEMTDAISMNYDRLRRISGRSVRARIMSFEASRLRFCERRMARQFQLTSLVSPVDRDYLAANDLDANWVIAPNGVDLERLSPIGSAQSSVILFIGNLASEQNQDACQHFIRNVLPIVRRRLPSARFRIVGRGPKKVLVRLNQEENVEAVGQVHSISEAARGALCGVCPVRAGAGIQNKVLEYLALGLPAVTSPVGLEGIPAKAGRELLVAEEPATMANMILKLFDSPALRSRLSANGLRLVRESMSWHANLLTLRNQITNLLDARPHSQCELQASVPPHETILTLGSMTRGQRIATLL
jgi:glycosyltransferase involved in cell wall biosynthesis